jgi:mRNA interferase MazF
MVGMINQAHGIMYKQREIILVPFPFSDLSGIKKRPVLVVSKDKFNELSRDIVVCVITSKEYSDEYSVPINNESLESGYLPEESVIKTQRLFTIHQSKIQKRFSSVTEEIFTKVRNNIFKIIV